MANINAPRGLTPVRHLSGMSWNGATNDYPIASGYNVSLYIGDPVKAVTGGTIERAEPGDVILGVFRGCSYSSTDINQGTHPFQKTYWKAGTQAADAMAVVVDDPGVIFEVQANGVLAADGVFANADLAAGAGSTLTGISGFQLDVATLAATAAQLRILRLVPRPDNAFGANAKVEVLINEHTFKATAGI